MDAGGNPKWHQAFEAQGCFIREHQQQINMLNKQLAKLQASAPATPTPPAAASFLMPSLIIHLEKDAGDSADCKAFMLQYSLYFTGQEGVSEHIKTAHFINYSPTRH